MLTRTVPSGIDLVQEVSRLGVSIPPKKFDSGGSNAANWPISAHYSVVISFSHEVYKILLSRPISSALYTSYVKG